MSHRLWRSRLPCGAVLAVAREVRHPRVRVPGGGSTKNRLRRTSMRFEVEGWWDRWGKDEEARCYGHGAACRCRRRVQRRTAPSGSTFAEPRPTFSACTPGRRNLHRTAKAAVLLGCLLLQLCCEPSTGVAVSLKKGAKRPGEAKIRKIATSASAKAEKTDKGSAHAALPANRPDQLPRASSRRRAQRNVGCPMRSTWCRVPKGRNLRPRMGWRLSTTRFLPVARATRQGLPVTTWWSGRRSGLDSGSAARARSPTKTAKRFGAPLPLVAGKHRLCLVSALGTATPTGNDRPVTGRTRRCR